MRTFRITEEDETDSGAGIIIALLIVVGIISAIVKLIIKIWPYLLAAAAVAGIIVLIVRANKREKEKLEIDKRSAMEQQKRAEEQKKKEKETAVAELEKWHSMLKQGIINKSEFEVQKERLMTIINKNTVTADNIKLLN